MITSEWTIVAAMLLLPIAAFGAIEALGYANRRRERARAHRSKQRDSVRRVR